MKHNFSDLTLDLTKGNTPIEISIFRGQDYDHFQGALEDGGTYSVNQLEDICDLKLSHFQLAGAMSAGDMFGQPEIMYAVHDDSQLFFECESTELTEEFVEDYRMQYLHHFSSLKTSEQLCDHTIIGWNSSYGGSFAVNVQYPASFSRDDVEYSAVDFIKDISAEHAGDDEQDPEHILFITNVLDGCHAEMFNKFEHTAGHDQYNFPIKMKKWEYKLLSGNVLWCGGDYGTVEADTKEGAMEVAVQDLENHFDEVNRRLKGFDKFYFSKDDIEVTEV